MKTEPRKCLGSCGQILSVDQVANPRQSWRCSPCRIEYQRDFRSRNPDYYKNRYKSQDGSYQRAYHKANRARKHGLSLEEYENLLTSQGNRCKICLEEFPTTPEIDHNHICCPGHYSCGKCVRGLLCGTCNRALGGFRDSVERLESAIRYLKGE